jgi:hypothetical protein
MADLVKQRTIGKIRRLFLKREPLNLSAVKRRHPELLAGVYAVRPFWGWKQALADAGIEYSEVNVELLDYCTCRICGTEAAILTSHLKGSHALTPEDYRKEFEGAEIMAETVRAARMRAKAALPHWEPVWSWEYVLDRLWVLRLRGWPLNNIEIQQRERPLFNFVWSRGRPWDEVLQAMGLNPAEIRKRAVGLHLSKRDVVRGLKRRFGEGKPLAESIVSREELRLSNAARRGFGGYSDALRAAGFEPEQIRLRRPKVTADDLAKLGEEMTRVASLHGHERAKAASSLKKQYTSMVFNRLGNWRKACQKFKLLPEDVAVCPYASKAHVIEGLRRWALVPGASGQRIYREDCPLHRAACRLFGTWAAAKKAAGISFEPQQRRNAE